MESLEILYCSNFWDATVLSKVHFPKLRSLVVRGSYGRVVSLSEIDVNIQTDLEVLKLYQTQVHSTAGFSKLSSLKVLEVTHNKISDFTKLAYFNSSTQFSLCGNLVQDVSALKSWADLEFLDLSCNRVSDLSPLRGLNLK